MTTKNIVFGNETYKIDRDGEITQLDIDAVIRKLQSEDCQSSKLKTLAAPTCPASLVTGTTKTLQATVTGGYAPFTYAWQIQRPSLAVDNFSTDHFSYTFSEEGVYRIQLVVSDSCPSGAQSDFSACNITVATATGTLNVSSTPSGANVYIDNAYIGTTPINNYTISAGTHILKLTLSGYNDDITTITITAGSTHNVTRTLTSICIGLSCSFSLV